jgi:hypothetical protein
MMHHPTLLTRGLVALTMLTLACAPQAGAPKTTNQDALFRQAMGVEAIDSPTLFVVHDLNLRVLSPKVRGFIMAQSWFADLRNVWVSK